MLYLMLAPTACIRRRNYTCESTPCISRPLLRYVAFVVTRTWAGLCSISCKLAPPRHASDGAIISANLHFVLLTPLSLFFALWLLSFYRSGLGLYFASSQLDATRHASDGVIIPASLHLYRSPSSDFFRSLALAVLRTWAGSVYCFRLTSP